MPLGSSTADFLVWQIFWNSCNQVTWHQLTFFKYFVTPMMNLLQFSLKTNCKENFVRISRSYYWFFEVLSLEKMDSKHLIIEIFFGVILGLYACCVIYFIFWILKYLALPKNEVHELRFLLNVIYHSTNQPRWSSSLSWPLKLTQLVQNKSRRKIKANFCCANFVHLICGAAQ